jgi:hypothetical protein
MTFTVGYTTTPSGGTNAPTAGYAISNGPFTMPQNGTLQSMSVYLTASVTTGFIGVYDATGAGGTPGNLIATSASSSFASGWNTINTTTNPLITSGTNIWPAVLGVSSAMSLEIDNNSGVTGNLGYYFDSSGNTFLPASFGTTHSGDPNEVWGIYGTFNIPASGAPATPPPFVTAFNSLGYRDAFLLPTSSSLYQPAAIVTAVPFVNVWVRRPAR